MARFKRGSNLSTRLILAGVAAAVVTTYSAVSGSGGITSNGFKSSGGGDAGPGGANGGRISASGHLTGSGTKASGNPPLYGTSTPRYVATHYAGRRGFGAHFLSAPAAVESRSTAGTISGAGSIRSTGQKPTGSSSRISDSGFLVGAGQKNAFGSSFISGSGAVKSVGKNVGGESQISGGGGITSTGRKNLEFGQVSGSGGIRSSGYKTTEGFSVISGEGQIVSRARKGETIAIDFKLHAGPLITFRIHVSPVGAKGMEDYLAPGSTNRVRATKMKNEDTGLPITNATVTGTLLDKNGIPVTAAIDFPMTVVGSEYRGTIESTVEIIPPDPYTVRVKAVTAEGVREKDIPLLARRV